MSIFDVFANVATGGLYGVASGVAGSSDGQTSAASPPAPDYSEALEYMSDNDKIVNLAQIQGQAFAMQQSSLDMEMQRAATLEQDIESLDVGLQTSQMDYMVQMTAEENRHAEELANLGLNSDLQVTSVPDLEPPVEEIEY